MLQILITGSLMLASFLTGGLLATIWFDSYYHDLYRNEKDRNEQLQRELNKSH